MDINVKNTYNLFFHPFDGQGPTKKGFGRLAASVAIFISTIGVYHLVVGSLQKYRMKHLQKENGADPSIAKASSVSSNALDPNRTRGAGSVSGTSSSEAVSPSKALKPGDRFDQRIADLAGKILDFTLMGSDGVQVRANLELLSQKTGYFEGLQRLGGKEIRGMQSGSAFPGETLQLIIDFLTKDSFPLNPSEAQLDELVDAERFYTIPSLKLKIESYVFYANHPQVIRPSQWKAWAKEADVEMQAITDEEAFEALTKGRDIEAILASPCRIHGAGKTVEQTRMHAYIPPGLSVEDLGKILKTRFPETEAGYRHIWAYVFELLKGQVTLGGWVEMTKDVIPGSRNQPYAKQKEMILALCNDEEHYEVPTTLEAIACCLAWNFKAQERLFSDAPWTYTRCQEQVQRYQLVVGGFAPAGLFVNIFDYGNDDLGVAALRKFS